MDEKKEPFHYLYQAKEAGHHITPEQGAEMCKCGHERSAHSQNRRSCFSCGAFRWRKQRGCAKFDKAE